MARTPIHPGEVLAEELEELGVSPTELSRQIRVPANRISQIINGKRAVTGDHVGGPATPAGPADGGPLLAGGEGGPRARPCRAGARP